LKAEKKYTDEELVRLFISTQHNKYFEVIYDRYSDKIFRKCYSFVHDRSRAEDFMHDIFLKLILTLANFKETAKFSTYIYAITYNHCIDNIKAVKKAQEVALDDSHDFEDDDPNWEETKTMEEQKLGRALNALQPDERSLVLMKYQDDLSIKEISETLKLNESTVKMRLLRAKEKIRKYYVANLVFWGIFISKIILLFREK
jgi:RNA polymerase sigma factor (sigma-70 family)